MKLSRSLLSLISSGILLSSVSTAVIPASAAFAEEEVSVIELESEESVQSEEKEIDAKIDTEGMTEEEIYKAIQAKLLELFNVNEDLAVVNQYDDVVTIAGEYDEFNPTEEVKEAISKPHTEIVVNPSNEAYMSVLMDVYSRIQDGTATDEDKEFVKSIQKIVEAVAENLPSDNDIVLFEVKNEHTNEYFLLAASTKNENIIPIEGEEKEEEKESDESSESVESAESTDKEETTTQSASSNYNRYIQNNYTPDYSRQSGTISSGSAVTPQRQNQAASSSSSSSSNNSGAQSSSATENKKDENAGSSAENKKSESSQSTPQASESKVESSSAPETGSSSAGNQESSGNQPGGTSENFHSYDGGTSTGNEGGDAGAGQPDSNLYLEGSHATN
ncbi:hypothetical protein ACWOBE_08450 [Hutsoniella sourekii]